MSNLPRKSLNPRQVATVEKLFAEAAALLEEVGHEQLTVRMVAARAGVSPATAYTYFASKDHLFAELFWRLLQADDVPEPAGSTAAARLQELVRHLGGVIAGSPALAAAVTKSLLGSDPEVERLRLAIGSLFVERVSAAIGEDVEPAVLTTLAFAMSGALLQAGIGIFTYDELGDQMASVVEVIMRGHV